MDSKTRAILRGKASQISAICQIGKDGLTTTLLESIENALFARELVKINVLKNCDETPKELLTKIAEATGAEPICTIGQKIVIYKVSNKKGIKHVLEIC